MPQTPSEAVLHPPSPHKQHITQPPPAHGSSRPQAKDAVSQSVTKGEEQCKMGGELTSCGQAKRSKHPRMAAWKIWRTYEPGTGCLKQNQVTNRKTDHAAHDASCDRTNKGSGDQSHKWPCDQPRDLPRDQSHDQACGSAGYRLLARSCDLTADRSRDWSRTSWTHRSRMPSQDQSQSGNTTQLSVSRSNYLARRSKQKTGHCQKLILWPKKARGSTSGRQCIYDTATAKQNLHITCGSRHQPLTQSNMLVTQSYVHLLLCSSHSMQVDKLRPPQRRGKIKLAARQARCTEDCSQDGPHRQQTPLYCIVRVRLQQQPIGKLIVHLSMEQ